MNPAEAQIIEQFRRLDLTSQRRVLDALNEEVKPFDIAAWMAKVDAIRATVKNPYTLEELVELIDDVRGEAGEDTATK